ncbi:MAG: BamA/TamA family outer membrane protein [Chitinophagaceae bacterium]|nr:BamA/TamA family outer membrane protein [Chitinophagaceae bacterium]
MHDSPTKIHSSFFKHIYFFIIISGLLYSCTVVKKYKPYQPFVFENEIKVNGNLSSSEKKVLIEKLKTQIEDSVKPVLKSVLFIRHVLTAPAVFDSNDVHRSVVNMDNLLQNNGYYRSQVWADWAVVDTVTRKEKPDQYRMKVRYHVNTGKVFRIDSISYRFTDTTLMRLVKENADKSLLRKADPFSLQKIDEELNRLIAIFRNNGYYRINREVLMAQLDTVNVALIDASADPFEQIRLQVEAQKKRQNPTIDISILEIPVKDSTITQSYAVGDVTVYPDEPVQLAAGESTDIQPLQYGAYQIYSRYNLFKPSFLAKRIALRPGELFRASDFNRTLLNFNRIEAWQNVTINARPRDSATPVVDFSIRMVPAKKYFFSADFEGSSILSAQNQVYNAGNKGLALNFQLKNRNVARQALQLENALRTGIEFTDFRKILSTELGLSNRLIFPRLLTPFKLKHQEDFLQARTYINLDGSYIDRYKYYKINTINAYLGYEFQKRTSTNWQIRFPNIEFTRIYDIDLGFEQLIRDYPLLSYSYNNGLIIGLNATYTRRFNTANPANINFLRLYGEESGLLVGGLFKKQTADNKPLEQLYRFVKFSADFRHYHTRPKSMWAFRIFAGYGVGFKTESRQGDISLPFFRQFFAGGPNSMRGWQLRKLGPGSSIFYDTLRIRTYTVDPPGVVEKKFDDRYADIQLEGNMEYRFDIFPVYGYWMRGALFADVGNVWVRKSSSPEFKYAVFDINRLYQDLAVAGGAGLRMDFKFFLLRFDFGWRLKDPLYASDEYIRPHQDGWFISTNMKKPTLQFGIGYPF